MLKKFKLFFLIVLWTVFLLLPFCFSQAASNTENLKRELEEQIRQKQEEINQHQEKIQGTREQASSLKNEVQILESQIDKVRAEIVQIDLVVRKSTLNIQEIDVQIEKLEDKMNEKRELLAEYIRIIAHNDQETLLELILKNDKFSDFFNTINVLEGIQTEIHTVLGVIQELKSKLLEEREQVEDELIEQNQLKALQLFQKKSVENKQWQKESLLNKTKGQEQAYQKLIQGAERDIAHIKEQLSLLEKYNITLDDAVQHAISAASKTGIRPAFLLGVLEMESRLGLNVGTGNWQKDMYECYRQLGYLTRASKEKAAFLQICQELGLDPDLQPVSAEPWYGCGGAMGIAQFMPTTWLAYKERVAGLTGNNPPNPWSLQDAFVAASIKLADAGANQRTEIAERTAYAKYLGGTRYQRWVYHAVTNKVIGLANNFQEQYFK